MAAVLAVPGLLGLTGCSSGDSLPNYLGDQYQPVGVSGSDQEFRANRSVTSVDLTVTDRFEPLESIRSNTGTFLRYDDNRYLSIIPAGAGAATVLFGTAPGRAYTAFQDAGGAAAAVDERGGGPGEGK